MANTVIGLSQRGSRWHVLIAIPPDLHRAYDKRRVKLALRTQATTRCPFRYPEEGRVTC